MRRVLVVDDEAELAEAVVAALQRHGFVCDWVTTLADAVARAGDAELVLLDLGLPDGDGLTMCAEIAARAPLIVISARGEEVDRVMALEMGADDYLSKPFSTRELIARCKAVLRRSGGTRRAVVRSSDLDIDLEAFEVRRDGEPIELTAKEMTLLALLAAHQGALVRRSKIAQDVWESPLSLIQRTLDTHISSLRSKLGASPDANGYIETMHGAGYRLRR